MPICYSKAPFVVVPDLIMLEFWFDPRVTLSRKLMLLGLFAVVTVALYWMKPLSPIAILLFLGCGLIFLICRYCKIHFTRGQNLLARLLHWIPIAALLAVIFMQYQHGDILILGAQGIGLMALAACLFSPFSLLKPKASSC
jgi:hypothetical protein